MAGYPPERSNCPSDPSIYPSDYYTQGLKEYSGQANSAPYNPKQGGILSALSSGKIDHLQSLGIPVQKLDILEAAKRKLIKSLVERFAPEASPSGYYSGLLDLVREYDSEWARFYDSLSGAYSPNQGFQWGVVSVHNPAGV